MMRETPELMDEWGDEFVQCYTMALMWADDPRAAAETVVREFYRGGKPIFSGTKNRRLASSQWRPLRDFVLERDGHTCVYCGVSGDDLCADHVVPLSRGGKNTEDNLVCACRPCNSSKSDRLLAEWRQ